MQYTTFCEVQLSNHMLCYQDFKDTFVCNTQQYPTHERKQMLCYQDFKDTFVCNTQRCVLFNESYICCVIRISKILLYAIHNKEHGST